MSELSRSEGHSLVEVLMPCKQVCSSTFQIRVVTFQIRVVTFQIAVNSDCYLKKVPVCLGLGLGLIQFRVGLGLSRVRVGS